MILKGLLGILGSKKFENIINQSIGGIEKNL